MNMLEKKIVTFNTNVSPVRVFSSVIKFYADKNKKNSVGTQVAFVSRILTVTSTLMY